MAKFDLDLDRHIDFLKVGQYLREHPKITYAEYEYKRTSERHKRMGFH